MDSFQISGSVEDVTVDGFDNVIVTGSGSIESISGASDGIVVSEMELLEPLQLLQIVLR